MKEKNEIIFDNSPFTSFVAQLENKNNFRIDGNVYHIMIFEEGYQFFSKTELATGIHKELSEDSRVMFSFIFQFHCGDWEGRLEFPDIEYWSSELAEMSECWELLEEKLKEKIINQNPGYNFE